VDPAQRETILSIGAFIQNLDYAADHFDYHCQGNLLARSNQGENIMEVRLLPKEPASRFDVSIILQRLLLQIRDKGIAIHPMTQVLEENRFSQNVNGELGITEPIQFIAHRPKYFPSLGLHLIHPIVWIIYTLVLYTSIRIRISQTPLLRSVEKNFRGDKFE